MSHFSNSWLKLLPSWHPLFHSGSVVPVWKLLRWGLKKNGSGKKDAGEKELFLLKNRYTKILRQILNRKWVEDQLRTIFHPLNVQFTVGDLKKNI